MENRRGQGFLLGLTGGVGAGKSTVLSYLEEAYGFHVIQTDLTARRLMEPGMEGFQQRCAFSVRISWMRRGRSAARSWQSGCSGNLKSAGSPMRPSIPWCGKRCGRKRLPFGMALWS